MELKSGYKQTDIGIIPSDWQAKTIGDVVEFSGGSQPPKSTFYFQQRTGYVRLIQIRDYKTDDFETYIPEHLARKRCSSEDIMIGRYGPPIFQILRGIVGAYNVALMKAIPKDLVDREFLYYYLKQDALLTFVEALSQRSSGQTGVELDALKDYPFPLPPFPEQQAIAEALSDVDALLSALDALLIKKRHIKQGAMQELLTGHKRLSGFTGAWEVKALGEICSKFTNGGTPSTALPDYWKGNIPWISGADVVCQKITYVRRFVTPDAVRNSSTNVVESGNLLLVTRTGVGKLAIAPFDIAISQDITGVYLQENKASTNYVFHYLNFRSDVLSGMDQGTSISGITRKTLATVSIDLPCSLSEQQAIAEALSDMDAELETLERQCDKTRALKQGMMQELLTGQKRLR